MKEKNDESKERKSGLLDRVAVDTALIVAICSGVFFLSGSVYFEELYSVLGVPSEQLQITIERKLLYGSVGYFSLLIVLLLIAAGVAFSAFVGISFDGGRGSPLPWRTRRILLRYRQKKIIAKRCLVVVGTSFLSILLWKVGIDMPSAMAKKDAEKFSNECLVSVFYYKDGDKESGCYIGEGGDNYYVLAKGGVGGEAASQSVALSKLGLKKIITPIEN